MQIAIVRGARAGKFYRNAVRSNVSGLGVSPVD